MQQTRTGTRFHAINWGDGSPSTVTNGGIAVHEFPADVFRAYTVTITVSDGRGGQTLHTVDFDFPAPAANQAPQFEVSQLIDKDGFDVAIAVAAFDPDNDAVTYEINWGDGAPVTTQQSGIARHTYPDGVYQNYQITVTADDGRQRARRCDDCN